MNTVLAIIAGLGTLAGAASALLVWRARRPLALPPVCCTEPAPAPGEASAWMSKLVASLDYVRTRREWRYKTAWLLLLGARGAGKSSLAQSAAMQLQPDRRQLALAADGARWHFLAKGVLIDPAMAAPDAWQATLRHLDALRPERAIDGILLTVSAASLRDGTAEQVRVLAEQAAQQMREAQAQFEFALPVYVVVTACDAIDGFGAFWRAQDARGWRGMVGWSAPQLACCRTAAELADTAFDSVGRRLTDLQLDAAAQDDIAPAADGLLLFPLHLEQLRAQFRHWLGGAFHPSAWQAAFMCRGVYFTGCIDGDGKPAGLPRDDVAFIDDLLAEKAFAERGLARPTRQGIWSRNMTMRMLQAGAVAVACALVAALAVALWQLPRQAAAMQGAMALVQQVRDPCADRRPVIELIDYLAAMDADSPTPAIPISYLLPLSPRATLLADKGVRAIILPAMACRLRQEAQALADAQVPAAATLQANLDYALRVERFEQNRNRYQTLTGAAAEPESGTPQSQFDALGASLFDEKPSAMRRRAGSMLAAALRRIHAGAPALDALPPGFHARVLTHIDAMNSSLFKAFEANLASGRALAEQLRATDTPTQQQAAAFTKWLGEMDSAWRSASTAANPCQAHAAALRQRYHVLVVRYGYENEALTRMADRFGDGNCYDSASQKLARLELSSFGPLFVPSGKERMLNPVLATELAGLNALSQLDFMHGDGAAAIHCVAGVTRWKAAQLTQAAAYVKEYDTFLGAHPVLAHASGLYQRVGRHQLEMVLNQAMLNAQAGLDAGAIGWSSANDGVEQQLAQESSDFAGVVDQAIAMQRLYRQRQFRQAGALAGCLRNFAIARLGAIEAQAGVSLLYQPQLAAPGGADVNFVELGGNAVIKDYLTRQLARSQVLSAYAVPFLTLLNNPPDSTPHQQANTAGADYWNKTLIELNGYVQGKQTTGAVAGLDRLFQQTLPGMNAANCGKTLSTAAPEDGNDLFSIRHAHLYRTLAARCGKDRAAQALLDYEAMASSFNASLANKFPFADVSINDNATPGAVKAFFGSYDKARRDTVRQQLKAVGGTDTSTRRAFLDQLDQVGAFFSGSLLPNDSAQPAAGEAPPADAGLPLTLDVAFRTPSDSGGDQVLRWTLCSGSKSVGRPNRPGTLEWPYGQALALDLEWASGSHVRPAPAQRAADMAVDNGTVTFSSTGDWALLRMIELHRTVTADATDPMRIALAFQVSLVAADAAPGLAPNGSATLYMTFTISAKNPKTQQLQAVRLPRRFPRFAP